MKDYYQILGISKDSSQEDVKKAYRKLAHKHHPDKGGDEGKFKEINEAYQILGDKNKRQQYDRFGQTFDGGGGQGRSAYGGFGGFDPSSWGENFSGGGGGFGFDLDLEDLFESFFSGGRTAGRKNFRRGSDLEATVEINLKDVLKGVKKTISLNKKTICPRCKGSGGEPGTKVKECFSCRGMGQVQQMKKTILGAMTRYVRCPECKGEGTIPEKPCNVCGGEGRVAGKEDLSVFIPAGVDSGQTLKIPGKGEAGVRGGALGDLFVKIFVRPDPVFKRRGDDIYISAFIPYSKAVLGEEVKIPTLEGKNISLKIPAGVEPGKVFKISKKGIPHFSGWGSGDMFVKISIRTPKKLNKKQKDLLKEMEKQGL